ncbi:S8 family serine peptidase [Bremerella sp.]|uniref:S8 family serine peptidase n=1 Tax=Bremerella sp. TaxID=2795602 RepID=UPI00391A5E29
MGSFDSDHPEVRTGLAHWLAGGAKSKRSNKKSRQAKKRSSQHSTANAIETLEVRSMMAGDTISSIWFEDVAGDNYERNGGGYTTDSNGVIQQSTSDPYTNDWIVQLSSDVASTLTSVSQVSSLLTGSGFEVEVVRGLGLVGQLLVRSEGASAEDVGAWFSSLDVISGYELDIASVFNITPNDASYSSTYGMNQIDAPEAWNKTTGSDSVVVGVIDTGVDYTHPDLVGNIWTNPGEIAGNGIDDDGNGFVDDVHGFDFVNNDGDPMDDNHHGTHVAGTIAAQGNNGRGVSGVAWNTSIMALKFLSASGAGYTSDAVRAINYATMMRTQYDVNVRVLNNSWGGGGFSASLEAAIKASEQADILFVAAAGNDGTNNDASPHYPSNYNVSNVISVAATDQNDNLASFSNYGASTVDIAAPGVGIYSTIAGGYYASFSGTSMASPHVAGVAALAFAYDPDATAAEVKDAILGGGDLISGLGGKVSTGMRLNAAGTLDLLSPTSNDPTPDPEPEPEPEPEPNKAPTLGSVSTNPSTVYLGETSTITITAKNVADADGSVSKVTFYRDSNGNGKWDATDSVLGSDSTISGGLASLTINNPFTSAGSQLIFAQATDNDGAKSNLVATTVTIIQPDDYANTAAGATLIAVGSSKTGKLNYAGDVDYFRFSAVAGTTYVIDTTHSSLAGSELTLYGGSGATQLAQDSSTSGSKIVWTASTTGTVYLAVKGATSSTMGDYTLKIAESSPFELKSGTLAILGTDGNDSVSVNHTGSTVTVTMNGKSSSFSASQVKKITFDGGAGTDSARFYGTSGKETWIFRADTMIVYGSGFTWSTDNVEYNYGGASSNDSVTFYDTSANDTFTSSPTKSSMSSSGYKNEVTGARSVSARSIYGGIDTAMLYDSSGNDYYIGRGTDSYMLTSSSSIATYGFERTNVYSTGGNDQAYLYDSKGNDTFTSYGSSSVLSGSGFTNTVYNYDRVLAIAMNGGNDTATFHDTVGNDVYIARGNQATMYGAGYYVMAQGFDRTTAVSTKGGNDYAFFYDTRGNDTFYSRTVESSMAGQGYANTARGFDRVNAIASAGGHDVAYLFDTEADDKLIARSNYASLQGDNFSSYAAGFDVVNAYSTKGSDKTYVSDIDFLMQYFGEWDD